MTAREVGEGICFVLVLLLVVMALSVVDVRP